MQDVQMDTVFQISLFPLRVFSFSLYIIIFIYSLGFVKIGLYEIPVRKVHCNNIHSTSQALGRQIGVEKFS